MEPTVALALAAGESPHPTLEALGGATWTGYINITRPGKYKFSATVSGGSRVSVDGKLVLTANGQPVQ